MIEATLFIGGFIWLLTSVVSVLFGPLFGLDRKRLRNELAEFRNETPISTISKIFHLTAFWFSYIAFLLPLTRPIIGILGSMFAFGFLGLITRD